MYQNIFYDKKQNLVHLWDDTKGYVNFEYERYAYKKKAGGIHTSIFGDELEKIYDFNPNYTEGLFESDVVAETRTLIDLYCDEDDISKNHRVFNYDIEVGIQGGFAMPDDPWQPIVSIAFKDVVKDIREVIVLDTEDLVEDAETTDEIGKIVIKTFSDENEMLLYFLDRYEEISPTIITGWNIDGFDNPYLYNRLKKVLGQKHSKRLSPIGIAYTSPKRNDGSYKTTIAGVSSLDYLKLFKIFTYKEYPNYRLDTIGQLEVGMSKVEYDGNLNDLFKEDINKFVQYNLTDIDIVDAIDKKNKFIELAMTICHICHVPYEFIEFSSKFLEGALLTYLRRKDLIAPNKPQRKIKSDEDEDIGFEGAYVKKPIPGMYEWVFDLDLTSLYPSIIRSLNISPETLVGKVYSHIEPEKPKEGGKKDEVIPEHPAWSPEDFCSNKLTKVFLNEDACWRNAEIGDDCISIEDFKNRIEKMNLSVASNGAMYKWDKAGLLGDILTTWFQQRKDFRTLEKHYGTMASGDFSRSKEPKEWYVSEYGYEDDNEEQKSEFSAKYKFFNKRQKVQKILLNSLYGVLGLPVFRFYNLINAEAVTRTGQDIIKTSAKMGNQYYNQLLNGGKIKIIGENDEIVYYEKNDNILVRRNNIQISILAKNLKENDVIL